MARAQTSPALSNTVKDPDDWKTGGEPMTGAQASYLHTLADQTHHPEAAENELTKAEASKRIDELRHSAGLEEAHQNRRSAASQ